jgi:D-alanyl-D-alanine carboxypeptidase (penicillin-binding protein 5/6)
LAWPGQGQAAIYLSGFGWLGSSGSQTPVPIGSVTKIMTALVILRAHPLALGEAGPTVTVGPADVDLYHSELAAGDSVVAVAAGEQLSEFQLLEGLLIPSADNLAELLASWDAGSEASFVVHMNDLAASLGLTETHCADSSGLDPSSTSSARDLVTLARLAMEDPVFASIVAMPSTTLPVVGLVHNYNFLLGQEGVVGVKTGWTASAMGCLVFAAVDQVDGRQVTLVGAVLGQPGNSVTGLRVAGEAALALLKSAGAALHPVSVPSAALSVGRLTSRWASPVTVRAARKIELVAMPGARLGVRVRLRRLRLPLRRGARVGLITVASPGGNRLSQPLLLAGKLAPPGLWWRLSRT